MERIINQWKANNKIDEVVRMLTVQYRMNHLIMDWASKALYEGRLTAHRSVEKHLLKDLNGIKEDENTGRKRYLIKHFSYIFVIVIEIFIFSLPPRSN